MSPGFAHMLARLKRNSEAEIAVPVFDRDLEIARAGARMIPASVRHLIVEGNYLLLAAAPWSSLHALFDTTVMIEVAEAELRARLIRRWQGYRAVAGGDRAGNSTATTCPMAVW